MSTEFISFLAPPGHSISNYDRTLPSTSQPSSIPSTFKEAMSIREEVFVHEQHVPLENELDADDARSFHWVVYASVSTSSPPPSRAQPHPPPLPSSSDRERERDAARRRRSASSAGRRESTSTASRVAVGTIRLVPPPHPPHPEPGTQHAIDNQEGAAPGTSTLSSLSSPAEAASGFAAKDRSTHAHDGREPYIKLGRIAVLAPYRGLGLSRLLINAALEWASRNGSTILPAPDPAVVEAAREQARSEGRSLEDVAAMERWRGLVLVHAQRGRSERLWERFGFEVDAGMGSWWEEGIEHVGMWRRIGVKDDPRRRSLGA